MFPVIPGPQPGGGGSAPAPAAKTVIIRGVTGTPTAGSTNNRIPRFNAEVYNNGGADFTLTDSATLGTYFTIVTPGLYFAQGAYITGANAYVALAKGTALANSINLTTTNLDDYPLGVATGGAGQPYISGYVQCDADDLLWLISSAAITALYPGLWKFGLIGPF